MTQYSFKSICLRNIQRSQIQEAIKTTVEPLQTTVTVELTSAKTATESTTTITASVETKVEQKVSTEKLSADDQTLHNLKQKKESAYNALLEKVPFLIF